MEEVELAELPPPPAEPIVEKKKRAKKDDAPKPKVVRRKKVDEQPGVVDVQPSFVPPALDAGFFQQLGSQLRELEVQSRQKRLSSLSIV